MVNDSDSTGEASMTRRAATAAAGAALGSAILGLGTGAVGATPTTTAHARGYRPAPDGEGFVSFSFPAENFDLASFRVTGQGRVIHRSLPLGSGKPYILKLDDDGAYRPNGAVINYRGTRLLGGQERQWRAVVREVVAGQQTASGPAFAWSVTRIDYFERPGMDYHSSTVLAVWLGDDTPPPGVEPAIQDHLALDPANPGGQ